MRFLCGQFGQMTVSLGSGLEFQLGSGPVYVGQVTVAKTFVSLLLGVSAL